MREASKRVLGMRHFDVQMMGGIICTKATSPKCARAKARRWSPRCRSISTRLKAAASTSSPSTTIWPSATANGWAEIYRFLGLSVGVIVHGLYDNERRQAYAADVTYGTNNEFGFDYLRDNMKYSLGEMVQRGHRFAIVDEVDSILIDEARTPLIISGPTEDRSDFYKSIDALMPLLAARALRARRKAALDHLHRSRLRAD